MSRPRPVLVTPIIYPPGDYRPSETVAEINDPHEDDDATGQA